jgi:large subunit ribosomal protein L27
MAHKQGAGSTKNNRDSKSKRLGIKTYGNQKVKIGSIIVRQRGSNFKAGINVGCGKDYTLYSLTEGFVQYTKDKYVNVLNQDVLNEE